MWVFILTKLVFLKMKMSLIYENNNFSTHFILVGPKIHYIKMLFFLKMWIHLYVEMYLDFCFPYNKLYFRRANILELKIDANNVQNILISLAMNFLFPCSSVSI